MSDLHLGLVAIGVFVVVAVLGYNKWQEARYRREAERNLKSGHEDVLMGTAQAGTEPQQEPARDRQPAPEGERIEPTFGAPVAAPVAPTPESISEEIAALKEAIDFIVPIEAGEEITGEAMIDAARAALAGFSKQVRLEGYGGGGWEALRPAERYARMRAGIQLADRRGALSAAELAAFGAAVQQAAAGAGALASIPDRGEASARASDLDRFCGKVDIAIAMHVVSTRTLFAGTKIRALAEAAGLSLEEDGRFRRRDDRARVLFELGSMDRTAFRPETMRSISAAGLTLELDVPRAPEASRPFEQFRDFSRHLAQALDGDIVDDNRASVSPAAFDRILAQVQAVQRTMAERSIAPGSPTALRLFS